MPELFPPSTDRDDRRLKRMMDELVHDTVRTDPDSRHFQAINPIRLELTRTLALVRRHDTRPWAADVRQTSSVRPSEGEEGSLTTGQFLFGVPERIELRELRRRPTGIESFRDEDGQEPTLSEVTVVELEDSLIVQSGSALYRMDGPADTTLVNEEISGQVVSAGPKAYGRVRGNTSDEGDVAVQVDGLDIEFAGRGRFDIEVEFTGVATVQDGDDLSTLTGFTTARNLYDDNMDEVDYSTSNQVISVPQAGEFTLYYSGRWSTQYEAKGSTRVGELPEQSVSLVPIAESLYDVPEASRITCTQSRSLVGRLVLENGEVDVTEDGYVGSTHVGHDIHHTLPGNHHVLALGEGRLSVVEPEAADVRAAYSVPETAVGVTWLAEGLLGVVVAEDNDLVTYAINEIRKGQQAGLAPRPTLE